MDIEELAELIVKRLKETHHAVWIDPEAHAAQHEFVLLLMAEREEKAARRKHIEDKIAGSLLLSLIVGLITLIGSGVLDWLRAHLK